MIVYKITNKVNGKSYIGQTIQEPKRRLRLHYYSKSCRALNSAINKYGRENFVFTIVSRADNLEQLNHREAYYIKIYKTLFPNGYNLRSGGDNSRLSEETKNKISKANKGQIPWSFGKKLGPKSDLCKLKISLSKKGKKQNLTFQQKQAQLKGILEYNKNKKKAIIAYSKKDNTILKFNSMCDAEKVGFYQSEISKCCNSKFKQYSHKGYYWKYDNI